jgi:N-methylhydantoinase A
MRMEEMRTRDLSLGFEALEADAARTFAGDDISHRDLTYLRSVDARYEGQSSTLNLPLSGALATPDEFIADFHAAHEATFGHAAPGEPVEFVNLRVSAVLESETPEIRFQAPARATMRPDHTRNVVLRGEALECAVYARDDLPLGARFSGPAIVEESGATTVAWPADRLWVDERGNLRMEIGGK